MFDQVQLEPIVKPENEEPRIYVIVPHTVSIEQPPNPFLPTMRMPTVTVPMCAGRLMAQCAHVVSQMRGEEAQKGDLEIFRAITTIVLSVRNSRELEMIRRALILAAADRGAEQFGVTWFYDNNPAVYGTTDGIMTAVCTTPVRQSLVDAAIGHLDLYN